MPDEVEAWATVGESEVMAVQCPGGCGVSGTRDTYRAAAHPTSCNWMMSVCPRCSEHDELLQPNEPTCPYPETAEDDPDPHRRLSNV